MFERRLKIVLAILLVFVLVLLARAMQLQVVQREDWTKKAAESMRSETLSETSRGRILDCKGAVLAEDEPCIDACVDYRFIQDPPDPVFIKQTALQRVKDKFGDEYAHAPSAKKVQMLKDEQALMETQIKTMWEKLAHLSGKTVDEIDDLRRTLQDRISMRRRVVWWKKYQKALADQAPKENPPWYHKWIMGDDSEAPTIDDIADEQLGEERSSHVIIEAVDKITTDSGISLQNELERHLDEYPGLTLVGKTHRAYPYGAAACHVIGHLGKVWREDIESDPNFGDELRAYGPNDTKGRDGLEALGEPTLRGVRGITVTDGVTGNVVSSQPARAGADLTSTIDIDLQMQIEDMFNHVKIPYDEEHPPHCDVVEMHGAACVIELATGSVRALVSSPTFDLNELDKQYDALAHNTLEMPLMNRATQSMLEPGSTVKVAVGAGAITQGVLGVNEGIECTGYLVIGGKRYSFGKCWTVSIAKAHHLDYFAHHPFPSGYEHRGHDGNPDGFLTYSDALERSCNVFFETVADRLKIEGLSHWMHAFGLGRPTGIGIAESVGRTPDSYDGPNRQFATWTSGIGQGPVAATPLQMCNLAATIARRGIWMRPTLVDSGQVTAAYRPQKIAKGESAWDDIPSRIDLHLAPAAVNAAIDGMTRVVNSKAGTGTTAHHDEVLVAGKTGTAQASRFRIPKVDSDGSIIRDENGKPVMELLHGSTHDNPNPKALWYRSIDAEGEKFDHAWFIGFVPADKPQYAISVMMEYGGGGGGAISGPIAKQIVDALIEHGYLHPEHKLAASQ